MKQFLLILISSLLVFSCDKEDSGEKITEAPILPPIETMFISFEEMAITTKSTDTQESNWYYSASLFSLWNIITQPIFSVPVACFKAALNEQPSQINDLSWQWEYNVSLASDNYTANLTATLMGDEDVKWRMEISKDGESGFSDFLWFEGTSKIGRRSGQWILYHSPEFQEKVLQIDWTREAEEIGEITYTYTRELNNARENDFLNGSSLTFGLQNEVFDAYVDLHIKDVNTDSFLNTNIEWSRSDYSGRIMAPHLFEDSEWHCWDQQANNIDCN